MSKRKRSKEITSCLTESEVREQLLARDIVSHPSLCMGYLCSQKELSKTCMQFPNTVGKLHTFVSCPDMGDVTHHLSGPTNITTIQHLLFTEVFEFFFISFFARNTRHCLHLFNRHLRRPLVVATLTSRRSSILYAHFCYNPRRLNSEVLVW